MFSTFCMQQHFCHCSSIFSSHLEELRHSFMEVALFISFCCVYPSQSPVFSFSAVRRFLFYSLIFVICERISIVGEKCENVFTYLHRNSELALLISYRRCSFALMAFVMDYILCSVQWTQRMTASKLWGWTHSGALHVSTFILVCVLLSFWTKDFSWHCLIAQNQICAWIFFFNVFTLQNAWFQPQLTTLSDVNSKTRWNAHFNKSTEQILTVFVCAFNMCLLVFGCHAYLCHDESVSRHRFSSTWNGL